MPKVTKSTSKPRKPRQPSRRSLMRQLKNVIELHHPYLGEALLAEASGARNLEVDISAKDGEWLSSIQGHAFR